jgi:hypothetical protein
MKTKIISLMVLLAIAVVSCQKDEADKPVVQQDVEFGVMQIDPSQLKNDWDFLCDETLVATIAEIVIDGQTYYPQVFWLGGSLYTQAIKLAPGTHTVTKFVLWTALPGDGGEIVMATPNNGADFAQYVSRPVPFDIEVSEFDKTEELVDVLCFIPERVDEFGFFWFVIEETIIREQCFFGDLCIKSKADYVGSYYDDLFDLDAYPFDLPAIYRVTIERAAPAWSQTYTNVVIDDVTGEATEFIAPLCIKYPDRLGLTDAYTMTLEVYVAVGSGWDWVEFEVINFNDFYIDELTADGEVIDFVIGNCNLNPTGWVFPAYMNLPEKAEVTIANPGNPGYWDLNITSFTPGGSYDIVLGAMTGWCGDAQTTITGGNKTMWIYNSLDPASWPPDMPAVFTVAKINQVNWLFNNLGNYGYNIASIDPLYIVPGEITAAEGNTIQNAIWHIINGAGNYTALGGSEPLAFSIGMAGDAAPYGAYSPLPGGWAAVLMVPEVGGVPDATQAQLIFTVVDP